MSTTVRAATIADAATILRFIQGLADYEREPDQVETTVADIESQLFGQRPCAEVLIAESNGNPVGFALFFPTWSTWTGRPGIHLEDLFVDPNARGTGAGWALMQRLSALAVERGCARLEWSVLDWNQLAIDFYRDIGAEPMDEWTNWRLAGDKLQSFAANTGGDRA